MTTRTLHLASGHWYGWQMLPGYTYQSYDPYFSPIRIFHAEPLKTGQRVLRLRFWNALYAEGVQDFQTDLRVRIHHADYLVADFPSKHLADRSVVVSAMSGRWLQRFCPSLVQGSEAETAAVSDLELHLDRLFPGGCVIDQP